MIFLAVWHARGFRTYTGFVYHMYENTKEQDGIRLVQNSVAAPIPAMSRSRSYVKAKNAQGLPFLGFSTTQRYM